MNIKRERVELRLHTTTSGEISLISPKSLIKEAKISELTAIAVTDLHSVQNYYNVAWCVQRYYEKLKVIYGAAFSKPGVELTVLVKDAEGLKALYKLVSGKEITPEERRHLLFGAHNGSALHKAIMEEADEKALTQLASEYDYLELGAPTERTMNLRLLELGRKLQRPVVAVGDCHYLYTEEKIARDAITYLQNGRTDSQKSHLRTTEEMLELYGYLGEKAAYQVVVANTNIIADQIEYVKPDVFETPRFSLPDADNQVRQICEEKLAQIYGEQPLFRQRLEQELSLLGQKSSVLLLSHKLVKYMQNKGALTGCRGTMGSTLVAWLLELSDVNPMPAHYYCPGCKHTEFVSADCGFDLPKKNCPHCGRAMIGDGHDIPFETCLGPNGEGVLNVDLNTNTAMQQDARRFLVEYLGQDRVAVAGTISTYGNRSAMRRLQSYMDLTGQELEEGEIQWLTELITNVKWVDGAHPVGIMLLPEGMEWEDVTPVRPSDNEACPVTTHFEYYWIEEAVPKLDVLSVSYYDQLRDLFAVTSVKPEDIDFCDPKVYELFRNRDTCGVPEFSGQFTQELLTKLDVISFNNLVKVCGMAHGTNVWRENGEKLAQDHPFRELISVRDDVFLTLRQYGIDSKTAYKAMTATRKGLLQHDYPKNKELLEQLSKAGVPQWYLESMQKVWYLFPKAHAVHYVKLGYMMAWFKVYYPEAFYKVVLKHTKTAKYRDLSNGELEKLLEGLDTEDYCQMKQWETIALLLEARRRDRT